MSEIQRVGEETVSLLPEAGRARPLRAPASWSTGLLGLLAGLAIGGAVGWYAKEANKPPVHYVYRDRPVPVLVPQASAPPPVKTAAGAPVKEAPKKEVTKPTEPAPKPLDGRPTRPSVPFVGPALPAISGNIEPMRPFVGGVPVSPGDLASAIADVKHVASAEGAKIVSESPAGSGRSLTLAASRDRAATLVRRLRVTLGQRGSVTDAYSVGGDDDADLAASQIRSLEKKIKDLTEEQAKLLVDYYPDAQPVQEVERQISENRKTLEALRKKSGIGERTLRVQVTVTG